MDALIETMQEVAPNLGIRHGNLESEEFKKFLKSYCKNLFKYTQHNIIDLEIMSPQFAKENLDTDESEVIYIGYPSITPEEKLNQIRKYDTKFDWTRNLSDEEALSLFDNHIKTSKRLQEEAQKYGFEFIDTSFERESKVKEFFDEQIRSGKLERTDESYEKYYR